MKLSFYATRKHQFRAFTRAFTKDTKLKLTPTQTRALYGLIRDTAIYAGIEVRFRILQILNDNTIEGRVQIYDKIVKHSVPQVLGFSVKKAK